jgi:hypothetical protein
MSPTGEHPIQERLSAISQATPVQLGVVMVLVGALVAGAVKLGEAQTRLGAVESKAEALAMEVAAQRARTDEAIRRIEKSLAEGEGRSIRIEAELRYLREGMEEVKQYAKQAARGR